MSDPYTHKQKIVLITRDGTYKLGTKDCIMLSRKTGTHVQYSRSVIVDGVKYIIDKYLVEKDLLMYRECDYDPWTTPGHKQFLKVNEKTKDI